MLTALSAMEGEGGEGGAVAEMQGKDVAGGESDVADDRLTGEADSQSSGGGGDS